MGSGKYSVNLLPGAQRKMTGTFHVARRRRAAASSAKRRRPVVAETI